MFWQEDTNHHIFFAKDLVVTSPSPFGMEHISYNNEVHVPEASRLLRRWVGMNMGLEYDNLGLTENNSPESEEAKAANGYEFRSVSAATHGQDLFYPPLETESSETISAVTTTVSD